MGEVFRVYVYVVEGEGSLPDDVVGRFLGSLNTVREEFVREVEDLARQLRDRRILERVRRGVEFSVRKVSLDDALNVSLFARGIHIILGSIPLAIFDRWVKLQSKLKCVEGVLAVVRRDFDGSIIGVTPYALYIISSDRDFVEFMKGLLYSV